MDLWVLLVFIFVYAGMILGRIPGLALDRTGVALLGAIALMTLGRVAIGDLTDAIDIPTIALLFGLMVVSAQFRLSGFYSSLVGHLAEVKAAPEALLALLILVVGVLSAILANDIVCLAVTPVLVEGCIRRKLDPRPFLLGLACAANVGSAATLIGNPQNMLIGQVLRLDFGGYLLDAGVPAAIGLFIVWLIVCRQSAGRWHLELSAPCVEAQPLDLFQTAKGAAIVGFLMVAFLVSPWPREVLALAAAGILLCSRRMHSREVLGLVDWQLLVLFMGLFVVNHAMRASGTMATLEGGLVGAGVHLERPAWLFGSSVVLSNLVSNVPAVMLLLPSATHPLGGAILALSSTLAGNLFIVGSIANIIVIDQAGRLGVPISWRQHARIGVPVTALTLAVAAVWLALARG